ncbi:phage tail protein [Phocoenobacter skyensis]|uniref:Phage-related protein n=1 Tax=Phocoenobacter skyensis TaxID=97481 RepID=A0A1H8A1C1_9PAST|nr:phage tail protein [Pasteurella skyensis]MDP8184411.1 phage tail protein [Pasteurella skyensis]QLB22587.1 phage tail protein [Pasteurella skyensis]SEM63589.1 Phage-related protein [Pasteurella skyensis]
MQVFEHVPQWGMKRKRKPEVITTTFGDGYEQRGAKGLNNNLRTFDLIFKGSEEKISEIDSFLNEHNGVKSFVWKPYKDKQGSFKCEEWDTDINTGFCILTATFKEVVA